MAMVGYGQAQMTAIVNGRVVLVDQVVRDRALLVQGTQVAGLYEPGDLPSDATVVDAGGRRVTPGLIDLHIHGAVGHTFNAASEEALAKITATAAAHGVTSLLATTATAPLDDLITCLAEIREWMGRARSGAQVLGAHVEGPYFAPSQAGAQDPAHLRVPSDGAYERLLVNADLIRIFTYAPELPGALDLTRRLGELGIVAAAGHSEAREEDMIPHFAYGLRHVIHLWSGQSSTRREGPWRKPGLLEVSLVYEQLTAEVIADGKHLPSTLLRLAAKCIGPDRLCLVSDATSGAGLPEGARFRMGEMEYEVRDGVGMMLDGSAFAGSTTLLNRMVGLMVDQGHASLVEAVRMATQTPARVIGVDGRKGALQSGMDADIVIFEDDWQPWRVMIGGTWQPQGEGESDG